MAYGKQIKDSFYSGKRGEIAMPAEGEMPPVLADNPSDWAGHNQQASQSQEVEQPQEVEDVDQNISEPIIEQQEEEVQEEQVPVKQSSKSSGENLRILREAREKAERERDELMRYVLQMQQQQLPQQKQVAQEVIQEEPEVDFSVDDEALLEGKHGKQLYKKLQQMERKLAQYESQSSESIVEAKIKAQLPDFDVVVNQETIAQLNADYPEIASTLRDTKDLYSKATAAYKIMKKFGIYRDKSYDQEKAVAMKNASKPRTVTSLNPQQGDSPLSKANAFANGMNKDLQAQLLKEMSAARKNL